MKSNIPNLMSNSNITVSDLSRETGLSRTTITPLSKNTELPVQTRIDTLLKIASALRVPISALYDESIHWDVNKIYKVSNGLDGMLRLDAYIIKMTNQISYKNKPLFISIKVNPEININLEFLDNIDFEIISYVNKDVFDEININSLNQDINFLQSINSKFIYSFGDDLFSSKKFNTVINEYDNNQKTDGFIKQKRNSYFTAGLNPIARQFVDFGKNARLLVTSMDDLINTFNNSNLKSLFQSWAETNKDGKKALKDIYHINPTN